MVLVVFVGGVGGTGSVCCWCLVVVFVAGVLW